MGGCQTVLWIGTLARSDRTNLAPCFRVMLEKRRPVSDSKAKSIPWWAARLRMAHIWHYPPPGNVAHCFNLLHNVRYRTTERTAPNMWQRFESSCNQSLFNIFVSIGSSCSRSLFSFVDILYFMWLTSFDLILLWNSSNIFAQLFILTMKQK